MYRLLEIISKDEKSEITVSIMNALPKWFSPPENIQEKSVIHREYPFFAIFDEDMAIGFVTIKIHNQYTAELYTIGILEDYHKKGLGTSLLKECEKYCRSLGYKYLTVKTLDESAEYEPYNNTRAFYLNNDFIPLEVLHTFWDEENPCLFLVKSLVLEAKCSPGKF